MATSSNLSKNFRETWGWNKLCVHNRQSSCFQKLVMFRLGSSCFTYLPVRLFQKSFVCSSNSISFLLECLLPYSLQLCQNLWLAYSSLPSDRVRWGHWCKEWHLKKKKIFQEQGDIFSTDIKTESCPELTRSPPELSPADWWEQLRGSWMGTRLCGSTAEETAATSSKYLQQMPPSLSRAILPQLH